MAVDYAKEERDWKNWKKLEERLLRDLNIPEEAILALRRMDWNYFVSNKEGAYGRWEGE